MVTKIYFSLKPGIIRSRYDYQQHRIGAIQLARCYNLPMGSYREYRDGDEGNPNVIVLGPTYDYDERLMKAIADLGYHSPGQTVTISEIMALFGDRFANATFAEQL